MQILVSIFDTEMHSQQFPSPNFVRAFCQVFILLLLLFYCCCWYFVCLAAFTGSLTQSYSIMKKNERITMSSNFLRDQFSSAISIHIPSKSIIIKKRNKKKQGENDQQRFPFHLAFPCTSKT